MRSQTDYRSLTDGGTDPTGAPSTVKVLRCIRWTPKVEDVAHGWQVKAPGGLGGITKK